MFFLRKKKKEEKRNRQKKLEIINLIESITELAQSKKIFNLRIKLEKITNQIDDVNLALTADQMSCIDEQLVAIQKHMDKSYESYLINKCNKIEEILSGKNVALNEAEIATEKNNDSIAEIEARLDMYSHKIGDVTTSIVEISDLISFYKQKQDENIDNKPEWIKCYYELKRLEPKYKKIQSELNNYERLIKIENQNLSMLVSQNQNIEVADRMKLASDLANQVAEQKNIIDMVAIEFYASNASSVSNEVKEQTNQLDEFTNKYFSDDNGLEENNVELEYQRAREDKMIEMMNNTQNDGVNSSKTE